MNIELGGNIKLVGFSNVEPAKLVVVKKVVGNYTKKFSEKLGEINELLVELANNQISAKLSSKDKKFESLNENQNLFFALDKALSQIQEKL